MGVAVRPHLEGPTVGCPPSFGRSQGPDAPTINPGNFRGARESARKGQQEEGKGGGGRSGRPSSKKSKGWMEGALVAETLPRLNGISPGVGGGGQGLNSGS